MKKTVIATDIFELITKKLDFASLSPNEQLALKENRSKPYFNFQLNDGGTVKSFSSKWYDDYPWLTGSRSVNKLFCFACSIYGGDIIWARDGIDTIKKFTERANRHQMTKSHILNMEKYQMSGKTRRFREKEKAETTDWRKQEVGQELKAEVLSNIIDMIIVSNKHGKGSAIFDADDKNSLGEFILKRQLCDTSIYKQIYDNMNEKLVVVMETQLLEDIKREISETEFCSILLDKIPTKKSEYSVIVRYTHEGCIKERFVGLYNIIQIFDLAQIFNNITRDVRKAICHSYDGSHEMKPLRCGIKNIMPKLLFLPNYLHRLNTLLLQNLECINECRTFIRQVTYICKFFKIPKVINYLEKSGVNFPLESETLWRFHSKTIPSILTNQHRLLKIANKIILYPCVLDLDTLNLAYFVQNTLHCPLFMMFCSLFSKIFLYTDHLANSIQKKLNEDVPLCILEVEQTIKNISNLKTMVCIKQCIDENKVRLNKESISVDSIKIMKSSAYLVITHVVTQIKEIFDDIKSLKFRSLLDETKFSIFKNKFPKSLFIELLEFYHNVFDPLLLESELVLIYSDPLKRLNPYELYCYLYDNDLTEVYTETYRLLKLYLTYPLIPAKSGTTSITKLKNFLNITEKYQKSAMLFVEAYPHNSPRYNDFKKNIVHQMSQSD